MQANNSDVEKPCAVNKKRNLFFSKKSPPTKISVADSASTDDKIWLDGE